jgi:hypothetical protein
MKQESEEFFATGLQTYLDAKSAVTMFENEVQRRIKEVVTEAEHQSDLTRLFGEDWKAYLWETPNHAWVGQKIVFRGSGGLYFSLHFARDNKGSGDNIFLCPTATFWRDRATQWEPLWSKVSAVQPKYPALSIDNWTFSLTGIQPSNDWGSCKKALDAVIVEWVDLWRRLDVVPKDPAAQGSPV